jgi:3',5'-cyclic AMP phosphodiesterase CpdA
LRIVHLSDIHFWQYAFNPLRLMSKRLHGMVALAAGRARRFGLAGVPRLVDRVRSLDADHILITGDLTTTALPDEFRAALRGLVEPLGDPGRITILPGNHDRYTWWSHRSRRFERFLGAYAPADRYPWLRPILGLDPTRAAVTARGKLPADQLSAARGLAEAARTRFDRLIVACHYPVTVPDEHRRELIGKRMLNADEVRSWLAGIGPHLYCCGHVHAAWAHRPEEVPGQLSLNAGAPLMAHRPGRTLPGFLEIVLDGPDVTVHHHAWSGEEWEVGMLRREPGFFEAR